MSGGCCSLHLLLSLHGVPMGSSGKNSLAPWGNLVLLKNCRAFGSSPTNPFIQIPNSTRSETLHSTNCTIAQERIGGTFSVSETEMQVPLLTWSWQKEGGPGRSWHSAAAPGIQCPTAWEWGALLRCWAEPPAVYGASIGPSSKGGILCCGKQHSQDWELDPAQLPCLKAALQGSGASAEAVRWGRAGEEGYNSSQSCQSVWSEEKVQKKLTSLRYTRPLRKLYFRELKGLKVTDWFSGLSWDKNVGDTLIFFFLFISPFEQLDRNGTDESLGYFSHLSGKLHDLLKNQKRHFIFVSAYRCLDAVAMLTTALKVLASV